MSPQITEDDIRQVVRSFYTAVQKDEILSPIFATKIKPNEWDDHINHIGSFWSSIFLKTGSFNGNPMAKHAALEGLTPAHFTRWLSLFQQTTDRVLEPPQAQAMQTIAGRIGNSLQMGLAYNDQKAGKTEQPFQAFGVIKPAV